MKWPKIFGSIVCNDLFTLSCSEREAWRCGDDDVRNHFHSHTFQSVTEMERYFHPQCTHLIRIMHSMCAIVLRILSIEMNSLCLCVRLCLFCCRLAFQLFAILGGDIERLHTVWPTVNIQFNYSIYFSVMCRASDENVDIFVYYFRTLYSLSFDLFVFLFALGQGLFWRDAIVHQKWLIE